MRVKVKVKEMVMSVMLRERVMAMAGEKDRGG